MAQQKSRLPLILGAGAATGIGYYLYAAGGSPKAAENKFESDLHKASAATKEHLPLTKTTNAEGDMKSYGAEAGAKIDNAIAETNREASKLKSNAEAYAKEAKAEAIQAVNKFDQTVEEKAAKAKGGLSSWFGGSSK